MKNYLKRNQKLTAWLTICIMIFALSLTSCNQPPKQNESKVSQNITKQEVLNAQQQWGDGIIQIGKVYLDKGDYKAAAEKQIDELYGYNMGTVLFKPTMASEKQFRSTKEGALSYFVGGDANYPEDHGFAIKPWSKVRFENAGIKILGNTALAMGNYYFTPVSGDPEVKVEYSFAYVKDNQGKLRIVLHGSHLPYTPSGQH